MTWNIMLKAMISESSLSKEIWQNRIENDLSRKHVKPPWIAGALCYQFGVILSSLKMWSKQHQRTKLLYWKTHKSTSHSILSFVTKHSLFLSLLLLFFTIFSLLMIGESFSYLYKIWGVISLMGVHESLPPSLELQSK